MLFIMGFQYKLPGIVRKNYQPIRFCVLFLVYLTVLFTISFNYHFVQKDGKDLFTPLTEKIASASSWTLNLIGVKNRVHKISIMSNKFSVTIKNGCNGVFASMIFIAALLAYPFPIFPKILGVIVGIVVIQIVNLIRVILLFLVGVYAPAYFNESHVFFAQVLVISVTMALWLYWIKKYDIAGRRAQS